MTHLPPRHTDTVSTVGERPTDLGVYRAERTPNPRIGGLADRVAYDGTEAASHAQFGSDNSGEGRAVMAKRFQVVDCRTELNAMAQIGVVASTPEQAARLVMGEDLVRGTRQSGSVRARVYSGVPGSLTMVRLYARIDLHEHLHDQEMCRLRR